MVGDEGPIETVGWGLFALPGERERLRQKEVRRTAEVRNLAAMQRSTAERTSESLTADQRLVAAPIAKTRPVTSSVDANGRGTIVAEVPQFPYAPVDRRTEAEKVAQRAMVRRQLEPWVAGLADGVERKAMWAQAMTVLQYQRAAGEVISAELDDGGYPVIPYRLLVRGEHATGVVQDVNGQYALQQVPIAELNEVRILQDIGAGSRRLRDPRAVTRTIAGGRAAPSYVMLLGAIHKSVGGPQPSGPRDGLWQRAGAPAHGPVVTLIDNGISAEQRRDGWLTGLARLDTLDLLDTVSWDDHLEAVAGHGTFTAGIIQQVAPGTHLDVRRALSIEGFGDEIAVAQEIVRAAANGTEIINLSMGVVTADDRPPLALENALRTAIRVAQAQFGTDLLLVCAAGNTGDDRPYWPGAFSTFPEFSAHVVSVAALRLDYDDPEKVVGAEWSGRGDWVTCSTLGQGVVSTYIAGTAASSADGVGSDAFPQDSWATWSGTSFAAPQVVGAIVRIMQEEDIPTARMAFDRLMSQGASVFPGYGASVRILPV